MGQDRLLEDIWMGRIRAARGGEAQALSRQLRALLPVHHVLLTTDAGDDRVTVRMDDAEMMPALPLGDVLTEELGLDVPYGALVILRDGGSAGPVSYDAGMILAEILLSVLRTGLFPMERETDALFAMAASYDRLVEASGFRHSGLDAAEFRLGLAASLGAYWSGARRAGADTCGLFDRPDFLRRPSLLRYLRALDASFTLNGAEAVPARLMLAQGGTRPFDDWMEHVGQVVSAEIGLSPRISDAKSRNSHKN
ncbi:hypothetical protein GCM10011360_42070 [Primorskyibacter flagellatus]|uniref:Uncharacterized protein n=1 Tax=Primorskyibacter flagellatus TaxID=1387277 RepID=A0A917EKV2_9RHOB|nr:hypothetical protein [Primorskyibacter flagellatus]GGE50616.1 hypothetical protein GCM10011360_42070 [Primorskyibacter flagellatus]